MSRVMRICMADGRVIESLYIRQPFEEELKDLLKNARFLQPQKSDCNEKEISGISVKGRVTTGTNGTLQYAACHFSNRHNVVRLIPSRFAAALWFPRHSASTCRIIS